MKLSKHYAPVVSVLLGNNGGEAGVGRTTDGSDFTAGGSVDTGDVRDASLCLYRRKSIAACCHTCS